MGSWESRFSWYCRSSKSSVSPSSPTTSSETHNQCHTHWYIRCRARCMVRFGISRSRVESVNAHFTYKRGINGAHNSLFPLLYNSWYWFDGDVIVNALDSEALPRCFAGQVSDLHVSRDIALLLARTGKVYYAGNANRLGLQVKTMPQLVHILYHLPPER